MLKIENICKSYGKILAVDHLSLEVKQGQIYGLLGPNGSGKTTTLGIILGILTQDSGSFTWFDGKYGDQERKKIGALLETPNFLPYLSAVDNLKIVAHIKNQPNYDVEKLLTSVNLYERRHSKFSTFSLGMKQRLAIASALIGDPEILVFDEPTNGLDPQGIAEVRLVLLEVARSGKTVILASHILDEVEKICSHIGIMKKGKLLASGPLGSILNDDLQCELASNNLTALKEAIKELPYLTLNHESPIMLECSMNKSYSAEEINKSLLEKGIYLSHLVVRKQKLEEEFLQIISNKQA
jgi:ABC-type multidrug transport system ATPase subunit